MKITRIRATVRQFRVNSGTQNSVNKIEYHFLKFSAVKIDAVDKCRTSLIHVLGSIHDPKADVLGIAIIIPFRLSFYLGIEIRYIACYVYLQVGSQQYFCLIKLRFCHVASHVSCLQNRDRKFFRCQFRGHFPRATLVRYCYATRDLLLCNIGDVVTRQMIHKRYKRANCGAYREIGLCLNCVSCA